MLSNRSTVTLAKPNHGSSELCRLRQRHSSPVDSIDTAGNAQAFRRQKLRPGMGRLWRGLIGSGMAYSHCHFDHSAILDGYIPPAMARR